MKLWTPGRYAWSSGKMLLWLGLRATSQAATVIIAARSLGPAEYGSFIAVLAVAGMLAPLASLGLPSALLLSTAKSTSARQPLCEAERWIAVGCAAAIVTAIVLLNWARVGAAPIAASVILVAGEICSAAFVELHAKSLQTEAAPARYAAALAGLTIFRLAAAAIVLLCGNPSLASWMVSYATSGILYAVGLRTWRMRAEAYAAGNLRWHLRPLVAGAPFALSQASLRMQAEFNKPVLAQLNVAMAGNLSIAQRLIDLAALPLAALQESMWPRFYAGSLMAGAQMRLIIMQICLALTLGGGIYVVSGWLPRLLGEGYAAATPIAQLLCLLPTLQLARNIVSAFALRRRKNSLVIAAYVTGAISSILATIQLVETGGADGAIVALYVSEVVVISLLAAAFAYERFKPSV